MWPKGSRALQRSISRISTEMTLELEGAPRQPHIDQVVPRASWAKSGNGRYYHLIRDARGGRVEGADTFTVLGACGAIARDVVFHVDIPDDLCEACIVRGYREHVVYQAIDAAGAVIYVGYSGQLYLRIDAHRRVSTWFPNVVRWASRRYPDEFSARAAEKAEIYFWQPIHNVHHRGRGTTRRRAHGFAQQAA